MTRAGALKPPGSCNDALTAPRVPSRLRNVTVKAQEFHLDGKMGNLYTEGAETNIATFHDNILKGECGNPTVAPSVRSNLTTILGRMAAYKNSVATWDEMMRRKEKFTPELKGLKA